MKRYLMLGRGELQVKWLEIDHRGDHVTYWQSVPIRLYKEMPTGWTGQCKGMSIRAEIVNFEMNVPINQWLLIVPESKLPETIANVTLERP